MVSGAFSDVWADYLSLGGGALSFFGGIVGDRTPSQMLTGKPGELSSWDDEGEGRFAKERASCLNGLFRSARG